MLKIANIVGARPNFMKIAPIHRRMQASSKIEPLLIHTGQHYDEKMSKTFFTELGMPEPDLYLGVGSGTHAEQTAAVMIALEKTFMEQKPDWVLVVGDVNSTIAASLAASKLHIPIAHVEAGLRSFDRQMPEEINRILTDSISDLLFITEQSGIDNLAKEGIPSDKIHMVGNVMIDSLIEHLKASEALTVLEENNLEPNGYALVTLHRPSNVDNPEILQQILDTFETVQKDLPIFFPIHPRTRKNLEKFGLLDKVEQMQNIQLVDPIGYLAFLRLMSKARLVLTDSGGIQEETTYLGIPCITLRENTERPITVELGTNKLIGVQPDAILKAYQETMNGDQKQHSIPPLWDGEASKRIVEVFEALAS